MMCELLAGMQIRDRIDSCWVWVDRQAGRQCGPDGESEAGWRRKALERYRQVGCGWAVMYLLHGH
jgi:hypothetical protein